MKTYLNNGRSNNSGENLKLQDLHDKTSKKDSRQPDETLVKDSVKRFSKMFSGTYIVVQNRS